MFKFCLNTDNISNLSRYVYSKLSHKGNENKHKQYCYVDVLPDLTPCDHICVYSI